MDKQSAWNEAEQKIISARLSHHTETEKNILDTTVALELLGIHPTEACEGHIKHDSIFPYVVIESPKDAELEKQADSNTNLSKEDYQKIINDVELDTLNIKNKTQILLDEFYNKKSYNPYNYEIVDIIKNRKFALMPNGVAKTTQNQEAEYKKITLEESTKKLGELTEFLKQKYFETV